LTFSSILIDFVRFEHKILGVRLAQKSKQTAKFKIKGLNTYFLNIKKKL